MRINDTGENYHTDSNNARQQSTGKFNSTFTEHVP